MNFRLHFSLPRFFRKRRDGWNKADYYRASLEKKRNTPEGDELVIKGVSKRVIVVKSPDPKIFEQAIFIVREDYCGEAGYSEQDVLREAKRAAGGYLFSAGKRKRNTFSSFRAAICALAGAAAAAAAWMTYHLIVL